MRPLFMRTMKSDQTARMRVESSLGVNASRYIFSRCGSNDAQLTKKGTYGKSEQRNPRSVCAGPVCQNTANSRYIKPKGIRMLAFRQRYLK